MLSVEELTTDYGPVRAVDAVSLKAPEGTVTAVLGANGAGKTSLLRTITGLVAPRSGRVTVDGADITQNIAPCGSETMAIRPTVGTSNAGATTCPPSSSARDMLASTSVTLK